jgi:hypothetical protein
MQILQCCAALCALHNLARHPHSLVIETDLGRHPMVTSFFSSSSFITVSLILLAAMSFAGAVTA